jgi:predicted dehydrogenase
MAQTVNWGILGTGYAARQFASGLTTAPGSRLVAVGSRTAENAAQFAHAYGCKHACSSYSDLVENPDVDIVFIATPNDRHRDDCILALNANKAIVCEKPFALNALETREIIDLAKQKRLFCMEGMWSRFMPAILAARRIVSEGSIGEVRLLSAYLGHRIDPGATPRVYSPMRGGGALLDLGVYAISLATFLLGSSASLASSEAVIGSTGVDEQCTLILRFPGGRTATLGATICAWAYSELTLAASDGRIRIHAPLYRPEKITMSRVGNGISHDPKGLVSRVAKHLRRLKPSCLHGANDEFAKTFPVTGNGANYQAVEAASCLIAGKTESEIMPLADTLGIMEIIDAARQQWGLVYPNGNARPV